jgi:hypothetical protein
MAATPTQLPGGHSGCLPRRWAPRHLGTDCMRRLLVLPCLKLVQKQTVCMLLLGRHMAARRSGVWRPVPRCQTACIPIPSPPSWMLCLSMSVRPLSRWVEAFRLIAVPPCPGIRDRRQLPYLGATSSEAALLLDLRSRPHLQCGDHQLHTLMPMVSSIGRGSQMKSSGSVRHYPLIRQHSKHGRSCNGGMQTR